MAKGSVKKDEVTGTYFFVVDVGKDGIRKQVRRKGFIKKKEAEAAMTAILNDVNNDNYMKQSQITINELVELWLAEKSLDKSMSKLTAVNNRSYAKNHICPILGNIRLDKLEKKHIADFLKAIRNKRNNDGSPYSDSTIQRIFIILVAALNYAKQEKLIKDNVADGIKRPRIERKKLMIWTVKEVNLFLNSIKKSRNYIAYYLAVNTGLRQGEILGLPWSNVDFKKKTITVTQILERDGKNIKQGGKTFSSVRQVSISDDVVAELEKVKLRYDHEKEYYEELSDLVVCTAKGKHVFAETVTKYMRKKINDANLRPLRFHDLRHCYASLLIQAGVHVRSIQDALGHSNITMTLNTYSHLLPNAQHDAAKKLSNLLNSIEE